MNDVWPTVYDNVTSWSLGFLMGWAASWGIYRAWCNRRHQDYRTGHAVTEQAERRDRRYTWLGAGVTLLVAVGIGSLVYLAETYTSGASEVWNMCRHVNYPLGCLVAAGVTYRLVLMACDRPRWHDVRAMHLMLWFTYIIGNLLAAAMTSRHYDDAGVDATWVSGFRTCLMLGGLALTVWWPHPEKYIPIEGRRA
jgi:hypothetical protein